MLKENKRKRQRSETEIPKIRKAKRNESPVPVPKLKMAKQNKSSKLPDLNWEEDSSVNQSFERKKKKNKNKNAWNAESEEARLVPPELPVEENFTKLFSNLNKSIKKDKELKESKFPIAKQSVEDTFSTLFANLYNSDTTEKEFKAKISSKNESIKVKLSSKKHSVEDSLPGPSADNDMKLDKKKKAKSPLNVGRRESKFPTAIYTPVEENSTEPSEDLNNSKLAKKKKAFKTKKSIKLECEETKISPTKYSVENSTEPSEDLSNAKIGKKKKTLKVKKCIKLECEETKTSPMKYSIEENSTEPSEDQSNTKIGKKKKGAKKSVKSECEEIQLSPSKPTEENCSEQSTSLGNDRLIKKKKALRAKYPSNVECEEPALSPTIASTEKDSTQSSDNSSNIKVGKKKKFKKSLKTEFNTAKSPLKNTVEDHFTQSPDIMNNIKLDKKKRTPIADNSTKFECKKKQLTPKKHTVVENSEDLSNDFNTKKLGKKKEAFKAKSHVNEECETKESKSIKQGSQKQLTKFSNQTQTKKSDKKNNNEEEVLLTQSCEETSDENEDNDGYSEKKEEKEKKPKKKNDKNLDKTVFVGNLPVEMTRKDLYKLFIKVGPVDTVRLRGAIPSKIKISKKVADIKHKFHENLHSRKGFVVFKSPDIAEAALKMNGTFVLGHHIVVNKASNFGEKKTYDNGRTVFVGNLPFDVEDEKMWSAFSKCGEVEAVRVIRDPETGAGKGIGYVLFTNKEGCQTALREETLEVEGRKVRIKPIEGRQRYQRPQSNNAKNFAYRQALKAKKSGANPQSRKSSKKLMKKHQAENKKKHIAQAFKKIL